MIYLTSILHDPEGRLFEMARENVGRLRFLFGSFTVVVSDSTHLALVNFLKNNGINVQHDSGEVYFAYRDALQAGAMSAADHVLLVDFDRLMVWAERNFEELSALNEGQIYDYTIIERTEDALRSHPPTQLKSEYTTNYYLSKMFGFDEVTDFLGGAWLMSKEVAWHIIDNTKAANNGFYGEWTALALSKVEDVNRIKVHGLEWEMPYQFKKEVENVGLHNWMKQYEEKDKEHRMKNMYLILKEAMKIKNEEYKRVFG